MVVAALAPMEAWLVEVGVAPQAAVVACTPVVLSGKRCVYAQCAQT